MTTERNIERTEEELEGLQAKSKRLKDILLSDDTVSDEERGLMREQMRLMTEYAAILKQRIGIMKK